MAKNSNLTAAKKAKNDEFYTQLTDIEKELVHYRNQLRGKIILCNCDDPEWSNFWRYFDLNFDHIGIKALIATHYDSEKPTYKLEIRRNPTTGEKMPPVRTDLVGNGDFRSNECIELLKECDVVVTNPPFSLFREYVAQLCEYDKKFIIIGNMNCITYKEIFPLIKNNQMWAGANSKGGSRRGNSLLFPVPDWFESTSLIEFDGKRCAQVSAWWFTNVDLAKRHEPLTLFRRYADDPTQYPKYDNYDAINVNKTADIPGDYFGVMGVPISFLDKYCPEQFEILWTASGHFKSSCPPEIQKLVGYQDLISDAGTKGYCIVAGHQMYHRLLIRRK